MSTAAPQAAVRQHRGMDAVRELAQLRQPGLQLRAHALELGLERGVRLALREAQKQRGRDEALLRAVVEVALELAAGLVARLDDPDARRLQLGGEIGRRVRRGTHRPDST